jgi:phenylalanyl-tRNA synthetase beta chain
MNISLNWLKEFVSLSNIKEEEIKRKLTDHTVEVEKIISEKDKFQNIIVAKVKEIKKHPQADKLQIALLDSGEKETTKVICGASNLATGQLIALAKVGAVLGTEMEIKEANIRGESSNGMICSEKELGLGNDHEGIMVLDEKAKIGQTLNEYLGLNDSILEIDNKSLSNRPDLWGHYGIARELSVIFNKKLKEYENKKIKTKKDKAEIKVEIKNKNLCQKYLALKIDNIKIEESPNWIKKKLIAVGLKPINNIVDITNYVMLETGQPLHAFDAEGIEKIKIRLAHKNENFLSLDDQEIKLSEEDLIISTDKTPLALAGIIGGKEKEVNNTTTSIILESANFDPVSLRKTAQRLNLRTDAVMRFEKGLDPNLCSQAMNRAVEIIQKTQKKTILENNIIEQGIYQKEEKKIELNLSWFEKFIGQKIKEKTIKEILEALGMKIIEKERDKWKIIIPSWRQRDLNIKEDLAEEIIRIYSYNNIKAKAPLSELKPAKKDPERLLIKKIKKLLSLRYKMNEVYNYSFVNEEQLSKLNLDSSKHLKLIKPMSSQHSLLRQNLVTNLIQNIKKNEAKYDKISLFEIGNIFLNIEGDVSRDEKHSENLPHQEKILGLIFSEQKAKSFKSLKTIVFNLLKDLAGETNIKFLSTESIISWSDQEKKCLIFLNNKEIGFLAKVSQEVQNKNNIKKETSVSEININSLLLALSSLKEKKYKAIPKFPPINRDLAFVIDEKILYNNIKEEIEEFNPLINKVELFDVYSGDKLEKTKKSLAFHISYQSKDKTLSGEEIDIIQEKLIEHLKNKFSAQIRDF